MAKKNKKRCLLLVDGNNLGHRAYHSHAGLSHKGKSVSVIFGVLNMLRSAIKHYNPKKVIVVWDGSRHKKRLQILPEYKARTHRDDFDYKDWQRQKEFTQKLIYRLGIAQIQNPGMEADDYIYWLMAKNYGKRPIKILSNDKDFHHLIGPGVSQIITNQKEGEFELDEKGFIARWDITPAQHLDYLILTGDKSDKIPGYGGIGDIRAKQFLKEHEYIMTYLEDPTRVGKLDKKKLREVYLRNRALIDLEYFYQTYLVDRVLITYIKAQSKPQYKEEKFKLLCGKYNLRTFTMGSFLNSFRNL